MIAETTDYLQIDVIKYKPIGKPLVNAPGGRRNQGPQQGKSKIKTILLPIPSNISDSNSTKYGDSSLNSIGAALVSGVGGIMGAGADFNKSMKEGSQSVIKAGIDTFKKNRHSGRWRWRIARISY